jgi:hypothetical protein
MKFNWFKTIKILGIEFEDWTNIIIIFLLILGLSQIGSEKYLSYFFYHSIFFFLIWSIYIEFIWDWTWRFILVVYI